MNIDFKKYTDGLVPAIIQDNTTSKVLMLGFMNEEAFVKTNETKKVTFFSRSKNRLWTKGEESGNFLNLIDIKLDCDNDALLVLVKPVGPTCHTGTDTCWGESNDTEAFLFYLEGVIKDRKENPSTTSLFQKGINKVAQKVGEEAVELVIESKDDNKDLFLGEAADLMYHYLILLQAKGYSLSEVINVLRKRHSK